MENIFPYKNLHYYLDEVFAGTTPTNEQVALQKKAYWKLYHQHKKKDYRQNRQEVTLAFSKQEIKAIQGCNFSGRPLAGLLKSIVLERAYNSPANIDTETANLIHRELFLLIGLMEEIMESRDKYDKKIIRAIEIHLPLLEQSLQKL